MLHAAKRVSQITEKLPQLVFLHGNVAINFCEKDNLQVLSPYPCLCPDCKQPLTPSKLLYPVRQKNYNSDVYIKNQWDILRRCLKIAYIVTIFGYSAPSTDIEAVNLLLEAWGGGEKRMMERIEIVDLKSNEELRKKWDDFIFSDHYQTCTSFYDTLIAASPRCSTQDLYKRLIEGKWINTPKKLSPGMTWDEVKKHFAPILAEEAKAEAQNDK